MRRARCPKCAKAGRDRRGDNLAVYHDHVYCYSCGYTDVKERREKKKKFTGFPDGLIVCQGIDYIGITKETCEYCNVKELLLLDSDGFTDDPSGLVIFPHYDDRKNLIGYKERDYYAQYEQGVDKHECIKTYGKQTLGGIHTLDMSKPDVCIWEGEPDWLHACQVDKSRNHLYFPGAQTARYVKDHAMLVRKFKRIYIAPDNDEAGDDLLADCLELLPLYKTFVINYKEIEVNDLTEGILDIGTDIYNILINTAYQPKQSGLITGKELHKSIKEYFDDSKSLSVISTGYDCIDDMLGGGLNPGQFIALTAREGIGKSTLASNICYNIISEGTKCCWIGTEMQYQQMTIKFMERYLSKKIFKLKDGSWTVTDREIDESMNYLSDYIVFHSGHDTSYDELHDNILAAVYQHDIRVLFIDVLGDLPGMKEWQTAKRVLQRLNEIAVGNQEDNRSPISVVDVVHQRAEQGKSYRKPTIDQMEGGMVVRQKHTAIISIEGVIGQIERRLKLIKQPRMESPLRYNGLLEFDVTKREYYEIDENKESTNEEQPRKSYSKTVDVEERELPIRDRESTISPRLQTRLHSRRRAY